MVAKTPRKAKETARPAAKPVKKAAAASPGERLQRYQKKRNFDVTSEPAGAGTPVSDGHRFVVQRHRASRLHYDFRLEAGGGLFGLGVTPGANLGPRAKRGGRSRAGHPPRKLCF